MAHALGYQQITNLTTAVGLTPPTAAAPQATHAIIQAESQPVRYRWDGVDPTAAVGMRLTPGDTLDYDGPLSAIKFIQEAASAKLNVHYEAN